MRFVKKEFKPVNTRETAQSFDSVDSLVKFVDQNKINDRQEFWFTVKGEQVLFTCVFEFFYEG